MTTRSLAPLLPAEARRALWDRLWRDVLLRPRGQPPTWEQEPPAEGDATNVRDQHEHEEHDQAA